MAFELRILTGALAGQVRKFDRAVITIGRHSSCDLRFDADKDLDVSAKHAEIHVIQGRFALHDLNSTNGTFLNDRKLESGTTAEVKAGDKLRFGTTGPETEFHATASGSVQKPPSTEVRIAMAVNQQTAGLKRLIVAGLAIIVLGAAGAFYYSTRQAEQRAAEIERLARANDSMKVQLQASLARSGDTTLTRAVEQRMSGLQERYAAAGSDAERSVIRAEMEDTERQLRGMMQMDLPAIFAQNHKAVAIMVSDFGTSTTAGSAFAVTKEGLLVTNRHNVIDPASGKRVVRIAVKFTDTRDWLPARLVSTSDDPEEDLALIQMERGGPFPVVAGISRGGTQSSEGMNVAIIGYPSGMDTPMEGTGNDFLAKSTLSPGTVSKKTSGVLQIDSFATHGSSGAPVFSARGNVIGVVYGGDREAGGKIVYAVPPERLAGFIPEQLKGIVRD